MRDEVDDDDDDDGEDEDDGEHNATKRVQLTDSTDQRRSPTHSHIHSMQVHFVDEQQQPSGQPIAAKQQQQTPA